ncbi:MAG: 2-C-methyl-D-erythritol 4-phosphate cytidylyltransferase [Planctomycetota bacterium]|nr:MAG: 2-C-methyl-D-erythritol 4-phosphate cytidylyltransferase [Planctomycetota bacterium]
MRPDTAVVVLAAGRGRRLGRGNKALLELAGEPLLARSLRAARAAAGTSEVVLVMPPRDAAAFAERWGRPPEAFGADRVVPGGAERWESSRAGCAAATAEFVLVHDAARALVEAELFEAVAAAVREHGAALAAAPVADTLKRSTPDGRSSGTLSREGIWAAQTPQGARRDLLLAAFEAWDPAARGLPTDESSLLEAAGHQPVLVEAPSTNRKITTPADLELAEALLAARAGRTATG